MALQLRPFQHDLKTAIYKAWGEGHRNVMPVAATGSGKTVLFSNILEEYNGYRASLAHRQELVSQMSITLGRNGVRHNLIAPENVRRMIVSLHIAELGTSYYDPNSKCHCAGVDTLIRMTPEPWMQQVGLQVQDEAHHVLRENKWGKAAAMFPNAYGLFPTATPTRADGKGLGRHADGIVDVLLQAPGMRDIINMGYLTDYRIICVESDIDISAVGISEATGDFNAAALRKAHHDSPKIVGDVVREYLKYAKGKLGITFAVDVDEATKIAAEYRLAGIPAEVVSAKTPDNLRHNIIQRFKRRELLQLVNVDLFGEGFDLPAIEVVSFARHTNSFSLYSQQFGRALRLMIESHLGARWADMTDAERRFHIANSVKPRAIIIDHVGNVARHFGPPDALWRAGKWTLDRRESGVRGKRDPDAIPYRICANPRRDDTGLPCAEPYERTHKFCPHCGHYPAPAERSGPLMVDGDLTELSDEALAKMRGEILANIGDNGATWHGDEMVYAMNKRRHYDKQMAVYNLRNAVAWWAGYQNSQGRSDSESYRLFFYKFGIDVGSMMALPRQEAEALHARVAAELAKHNIDCSRDAGIALFAH